MKTTDLIQELIEGFTTHRDDLSVTATDSVITIYTHAADYPKCIGKGGGMIAALQMIAGLAEARKGRRARIVLPPPIIGKETKGPPFAPNHDWTDSHSTEIDNLLHEVLDAILDPSTDMSVGHADVGTTTTLLATVRDVGQTIPLEALEAALLTIFTAIGKANGRNVFVDITDEAKPIGELT
jgi:predicted RNA-binding protein YlqC (UPF0109 family)